MKKIFFLLFILISLKGYSQSDSGYVKPNNSFGTIENRRWIDSCILLPTGCGTPRLNGPDMHHFAIWMDSCSHHVFFYDPKLKVWDTLNKAGGSGGGSTYNLANFYLKDSSLN